jgi:hypothetical protein
MTKWLGKVNKCDICKENINWTRNKQWFVDGRTTMGPWALMCCRCFEMYGVGLGTGKGQKYDANTLEKIEG